MPEDVNFSNHANSWYSQSNGSNRNKESMGYGGLAYYDNATYAGPHSKGSFTGGSSDHPDCKYSVHILCKYKYSTFVIVIVQCKSLTVRLCLPGINGPKFIAILLFYSSKCYYTPCKPSKGV